MADISMQFHATEDELVPLVREFVGETGVSVCAIKCRPFEVTAVKQEVLEAVLKSPDVPRVAFTITHPELGAKGMMQFLDQNPGALLLDIGKETDAGLQESGLTARTDDQATLVIWRKLSKRVMAATRTGVTAVNPQTGATAALKGHRFSEGAKLRERAGVQMLPVAGTTRLRFAG